MTVEVLCVGDELLRGEIVNTNLAHLAAALAGIGVPPARETCVPDDRGAIRRAAAEALERAEVVLTIGGLGPTVDDVTRPAVADLLGVPLRSDPEIAAGIVAFLRRRGVTVPEEAVRNQACLPVGADILPNENGTAPGIWCETARGRIIVLLPGPPRECCPMVDNHLLPRLRTRVPPGIPLPVTIRSCGLPESVVEQRVETALRELPGLTKAYCAEPTGVRVRIGSPAGDAAALTRAEQRIRGELGDCALPPGCPGLVHHIGDLLRRKEWRLAAAESCTGGLLGAAITACPGCSAWFAGSAVTYANDWKVAFLGVPDDILRSHGAVSAPVVESMLEGLLSRGAVQAAVAVSGIAGPAGEVPGKPVGTVFIGISLGAGNDVRRFLFPGDRDSVRVRAVGTALTLLRSALLEASAAPAPIPTPHTREPNPLRKETP
ncbi:MAG: CinA family nicotinamide mononucleotide deamidase-related protein [Lentisphaeria bacterium]|nr:CinA family nicotinamide mononucleotide deamidase-related protein [Lentisphaeria bacterium]